MLEARASSEKGPTLIVLMEKSGFYCLDSSHSPSELLPSESDFGAPSICSLILSNTSVKILEFARPFDISFIRLALICEILF